jgi:hypothetical protein
VAVLASPPDWLRASTPSAGFNRIRFDGSDGIAPPLSAVRLPGDEVISKQFAAAAKAAKP